MAYTATQQVKSNFLWLPVETIIHDRQHDYYHAVNVFNNEGNATVFIQFMLSTVQEVLVQALDGCAAANHLKGNIPSSKNPCRWYIVERFLQKHGMIANADAQKLLGVSPATANRLLNMFVLQNKPIRIHRNGHWAFEEP